MRLCRLIFEIARLSVRIVPYGWSGCNGLILRPVDGAHSWQCDCIVISIVNPRVIRRIQTLYGGRIGTITLPPELSPAVLYWPHSKSRPGVRARVMYGTQSGRMKSSLPSRTTSDM